MKNHGENFSKIIWNKTKNKNTSLENDVQKKTHFLQKTYPKWFTEEILKNFGFEKPKPKNRNINCSSQQFCPTEFLIERKIRKNLKPALVCKCKAVKADLDEATRSCCFWENWEFESREKTFLIAFWSTLDLSRLRVQNVKQSSLFLTYSSLLTKTHNDSDLDERNAAGRSKINQAWRMRPIKNDISFWHFCSTRIQMQGMIWEN